MRNAPALRNVKAKARRKVGGGLLRHRVAPCAERHKQLALAVKRQIAVHHRGKTERLQTRDLLTVFLLYRCRKVLVALLNAVPNVVHVVRPHALLQAVFPVIAAGSQYLAVRPDEHRLNARRAKLQAEYRFAPADQRGNLVAFHIYPSFHGKPAVCVIFSFRLSVSLVRTTLYNHTENHCIFQEKTLPKFPRGICIVCETVYFKTKNALKRTSPLDFFPDLY